ncbi:MAG TPA: ABC transporter substrate-binding protein [Devosiaceae bacterium]|nr:ABC transporter substrate-binding protein [Devosiaceae bacterium]
MITSAAGLGGAALSGCAMDGTLMGDAPGPDVKAPASAFTPSTDQLGNGPAVVGLLATDEIGNLSGGAPNSIYFAAKLALNDLSIGRASILVRGVQDTPSLLAAAEAVETAGVGAVVGPVGDMATAGLMKALSGKSIPVLSLGRTADLDRQVYGAGVDYDQQAEVAVKEMKARGYTAIVIATSSQYGSELVGAATAAAAGRAGIAVRPAHIVSPDKALATIAFAASGGPAPSALMLAVSPDLAQLVLQARSTDPHLAKLPVIGNAGWGLAYLDPADFTGVWYPTLPLDSLKSFADRFALAYSDIPTLDGVIAYDLTILALALPQMAGKNPYRREVMTSAKGFKGQAGPFFFSPSTGLATRQYSIAVVS